MYILLSAKKRACLCKSIAIEMGGVSRYFSKVSGSGVDVTFLKERGVNLYPLSLGGGRSEILRLMCSLKAAPPNLGGESSNSWSPRIQKLGVSERNANDFGVDSFGAWSFSAISGKFRQFRPISAISGNFRRVRGQNPGKNQL